MLNTIDWLCRMKSISPLFYGPNEYYYWVIFAEIVATKQRRRRSFTAPPYIRWVVCFESAVQLGAVELSVEHTAMIIHIKIYFHLYNIHIKNWSSTNWYSSSGMQAENLSSEFVAENCKYKATNKPKPMFKAHGVVYCIYEDR